MDSTAFKHNTNWCVITGAPSSGKTSVVEELAHRGYAIQTEVARELIEDGLRKGLTLADIRDKAHVQQLQRRILKLKAAREMALHTETFVFMDRGLPDSVAYYRLAGLDTADAIAASHVFRYRAIFLFDRLPLKNDGVRTESDKQAQDIDRMLEEDYKNLGYTVTRVPVLSVAARADFILQRLGLCA